MAGFVVLSAGHGLHGDEKGNSRKHMFWGLKSGAGWRLAKELPSSTGRALPHLQWCVFADTGPHSDVVSITQYSVSSMSGEDIWECPCQPTCALLLWRKPHFSASDPFRVGEQLEASHIGTDLECVPWGLSYSRSVGLIFWLLYHLGDSLVPLHILSKSLYSCWSPGCSIRGLSLWFLQVVFLYVCLKLFFSFVPIPLHLPFPGAVSMACQKW